MRRYEIVEFRLIEMKASSYNLAHQICMTVLASPTPVAHHVIGEYKGAKAPGETTYIEHTRNLTCHEIGRVIGEITHAFAILERYSSYFRMQVRHNSSLPAALLLADLPHQQGMTILFLSRREDVPRVSWSYYFIQGIPMDSLFTVTRMCQTSVSIVRLVSAAHFLMQKAGRRRKVLVA